MKIVMGSFAVILGCWVGVALAVPVDSDCYVKCRKIDSQSVCEGRCKVDM